MPQDGATRTSKYLALRLRHRPDEVGLKMTPDGWVDAAALLRAAEGDGMTISGEQLQAIVATNDKQRYEFDATGRRIRARQGHSVAVDLGLQPRTPPEVLYHGTARRFADRILAEGLRPMGRQHVHLSPDPATATDVGGRRGAPLVLAVQAGTMFAAGHDFWMSANGVWLALAVPPAFIDQA
ncbi:MAG: RNA 2'-phosphotransferase [Actinobacteria bacterium]|nr:RNA 2'-phosphotransferase [Actinomycetota bacterium]